MPDWYNRNRHRYPPDWDVIAKAIKEAADWTCEACGNPHGPSPYVLTVDHCVDHDPANVSPENLAALCQRCHLRRQGMRPRPATKDEAIQRLRHRYECEQGQMTLPMEEFDGTTDERAEVRLEADEVERLARLMLLARLGQFLEAWPGPGR